MVVIKLLLMKKISLIVITSINEKKGIAETKFNKNHDIKIVITKFFSFKFSFLLNRIFKNNLQ